MKDTLRPGLELVHRFTVTDNKTVPALYPESGLFRDMPAVFATGYLVGFLEWAAIELLAPHLDAGEQSLGTHINVSHAAPTLPGVEVRASVRLTEVDGRRLLFAVEARDDRNLISRGTHERHVIDRARFDAKLAAMNAG